ncbi:MAG TPA: MFS transporter [Acidimicrobiales bacterium]|nr:MFS transporter [Acidimicrobiales bacterium]
MTASMLNPVNTSLIATALVPIADAVHVSVGQTAVLVSAPYLASAVAQPTTGKLAEELGPRRVFLVGLVTVPAMVSANQTTLYHQVAPDQIGTASGLFKTFGSIGSIASSALIAIAFHTGVSDAHLHVLALVMVVVSLLGLVIVVADRRVMALAHLHPGQAGHATRPIRDERPYRGQVAPTMVVPTAQEGARNFPRRWTPTLRSADDDASRPGRSAP